MMKHDEGFKDKYGLKIKVLSNKIYMLLVIALIAGGVTAAAIFSGKIIYEDKTRYGV